MKIITSVTIFNDAVGLRMSASYAELNETTGEITADNKRFDRVVVDDSAKTNCNSLFEYALSLLTETGQEG